MRVILMCPRCKDRTEITFEDYCGSLLPTGTKRQCENPLCQKNILVYHKDVP